MNRMSICVVIVTQNRIELLKKSVGATLKAASHCDLNIALTILFNGTEQRHQIEFHSFQAELKESVQIRKIEITKQSTPAEARNLALKENNFDWIYFLDDDAYPPEDHFSKFSRILSQNHKLDIIGGPNLTPPSSTLFQMVTGSVLKSRFATWNTHKRYSSNSNPGVATEKDLILCNLFIKNSVAKVLEFNADLICAEENWFLIQSKKFGFHCFYDPTLFVFHERRPNFTDLSRQCFKYGFGRAQIFKIDFFASNLTHLIPSLFLALNFSLIFSFRALTWLYFIVVTDIIYFSVLSISCLFVTERLHRIKSFFIGLSLFPTIHASYGLGFIKGLLFQGDKNEN